MSPGATPKDTTSDKESNCFPISDEDFSSLATKPSRKSMTAAIKMQIEAHHIF
jgi:hypothetical protein